MRRALCSIVLAVTLGTAALLPGAAVFAQAPDAACDLDRFTREALVDAVDLIVVAHVVRRADGFIRLEPEAYLKGAATRGPFELEPPAAAGCAVAEFADGARVLAMLVSTDGEFAWPAATEVYVLDGGNAVSGGLAPETMAEADLVAELRGLTGQYAVPADDPEDGAAIEWVGTVLPVGLGLLAILAVSLVMLREWHRIDPS